MKLFAGNYQKAFNLEVAEAMKVPSKPGILLEQDILHLPDPVQKYLRYTAAIGKERIEHIRLEFAGKFKTDPERKYANFKSVQYNFFQHPTRLFYMKMPVMGIPCFGLHVYKNATASMKINLASLITVVDAKGPEMDMGETVTVFNDMCVMAPAALIDADVKWQTIDSLTVKAEYTLGANRITATLYFNATGQLVNFISNDRYLSSDGKTYSNYPWSTPVKEYREFHGRMMPSYGETIWFMPEGEYVYGKFNLIKVDFNGK